MATVISIRFTTGRAHLHPWQSAPSEGQVEWPPSPWRLLRALVAVAGRNIVPLPHDPAIAEPLNTGKYCSAGGTAPACASGISLCLLADLLLSLAQKPPAIWLPRTSYGHLRHFHPFPVYEKGKGLKTSGSPILDAFAVVDPEQPIYFEWPKVSLTDAQQADLKLLLSHLTYFGRAESWCEAELLDDLPTSLKENQTHLECPCIEEADEATRKSLGQEHVDYEVKRRLAWEEGLLDNTMSLLGFGALKNERCALLLKQSELKRTDKYNKLFDNYKKKRSGNNRIKKSSSDLWNELRVEAKKHLTTKNDLKKQIGELNARLDEFDSNKHLTLLRCLLRETGQDRSGSAGLPRPIGTRWVHYAVPREVFRVPNAPRSKPRPADDFRYNPQSESLPETERVQVVRFALNTNTVHRAVLPNITATVAVAQRIRTVALGIFGKQNQGKLSPQLTGKGMNNTATPWQLFDQSTDSVSPLGDHAAHAHWWLTDEDHDGFLDHLNVVCEKGFSRADVAALQSLVKVQQRDGFPDLLLTPIFIGRLKALTVPGFFQSTAKAITFVSVTPYFCPIHLTHGKKGGQKRSLAAQIRKELGASSEAATVQEIVFDYDPTTLNTTPNPRNTAVTLPRDFDRDTQGVLTGVTDHPLVISKFHADLPVAPETDLGQLYPNAFLKDPDAPCPLGQRCGLYVARGTRFLPAQKFASTRKGDQTKGPGRMLVITFAQPRSATPFALGKFSHFGLGLFVPVFGTP